MFDQKDIDLVSNCINDLAPKNPKWRARLIVKAARQSGVSYDDLMNAINDLQIAEEVVKKTNAIASRC